MSSFSKILSNRKSPPIWFMRQAGRYMPEYALIRKKMKNFLDLCYNKDNVVEVTLQPIKRFDLDFAIIFSDILVLPDSMGWDVRFEEGIGPVLEQFKSHKDFLKLQSNCDKLNIVYEAISKTKDKLPKTVPLIGFAGSPWTVVSYLLEGRGKHQFVHSKKFIYQNRNLTEELIDLISEKTAIHLINQIKAGADIVQLFDSWSGVLSGTEYERFVIEPTVKIISTVKKVFPDIPVIGFPKGSGFLYEKYINETGIDCVGIDQYVPIDLMKKWQSKLVVQGNLDPVLLLTDKKIIASKVDSILNNISRDNFIFNLGHGILPETPVENVEFLVNYVRKFYE